MPLSWLRPPARWSLEGGGRREHDDLVAAFRERAHHRGRSAERRVLGLDLLRDEQGFHCSMVFTSSRMRRANVAGVCSQ